MPEGTIANAEGPDDIENANTGDKRPSSSARKTDAAQRAKRVRVSRACDQCRAGREKCDGGQPFCQTCEVQGRSCTYHEQPKKRGIQPNYIRTLELTLAWLFEKYPKCEAQLSRLLPRSDESAHQLIAWKDPTSSENLHANWRNGIICKQIDQLLSGAEIDVPKTSSPNIQQIAGTQAAGVYQSPPLSAPSDLEPLPHDRLNEEASLGLAGNLAPRGDTGRVIFKLPENSWALLEHYFAFTQTWFPIIERHDVLKLMYTYPASGLAKQDAMGSGHAELWSIMAFASLQLGGTSSLVTFEYCRDVAKSLIPHEQGFQLGHIKALLILGLSELIRSAWLAAWLVIGSAVRLLTHFNLGRGTNTTLFEGRTKHTILAAFLLESAAASRTSAICHIRPEDIRSVGLLIEDGLEEWSPWQDPAIGPSSAATKSPARSISTFNALIRIALQRRVNMQMASPASHDPTLQVDAVFSLLHNASLKTSRQHPAVVIASTAQSPAAGRANDFATPGRMQTRSGSNQFDFINPFQDHQYGYMSIPTDRTESAVGSTPADQMSTDIASGFWNGEGSLELPRPTSENMTNDTVPGGDIFEELAMLDRSDSTQNPKFMQNLGFGPDLDLAEFFGADYQFTDPSAFAHQEPG
ncbi:Quinic acid utilization activator [Pseudocercospora fuligena]|uniref:Quinic acid utilization activator n=1 Tax=Pseudocercospora fuligena TaxID=685502 RepID=A0A8H6RBR0_9PEZI|nr:Quinic acid utilization activator [Pseudocercospora fuligena]